MKTIIAPLETTDFSDIQIDRIIEMAWEDRTPFDAIKFQFGLTEDNVKALMKKELKRVEGIDRFKCTRQRAISNNKITKR